MNNRLEAARSLQLCENWAGTESSYEAVIDAKIKASDVASMDDELEPIYERIGSVGVVKIQGSLIPGEAGFMRMFGATGYDDIKNGLLQAVADKEAKSIMLYVDSPGGAVAGVRDALEFVRNVGQVKPMSAYSEMAASAAYWLASAAGHITTNDTGINGSIGILRIHTEYSKAYEMDGITRTVLRAGQYKALGNSVEPLSDVAKAQEQEKLDYLYKIFAGDVAENRGVTYVVADQVMGQGKTFIGTQGIEVGLVDKVGTLTDALKYAETNRQIRAAGNVNLAKTATANIAEAGSMHDNQHSYNSEHTMKTNLTPEQLAAIAATGANVALVASVEVPNTEVSTENAKATVAAEVTAGAEAVVETVDFKAKLEETEASLQATQADLVKVKAESEYASKLVLSLRDIVQASVQNMHIALGKREKLDDLTVEGLVEAHTEAATLVKEKFKVGGVAASTASVEPEKEHSSEAKAQAEVDPMFVFRVHTLAKK